MKFNKFLNNLTDGKIHSSGIADAANSGSFGATSAQSFGQRQQIEKNRTTIRGFRDAGVLRTYKEEARFNSPSQPAAAAPTTEPVYGQNRQAIGTRIDVVKPSRQGFNAARTVAKPTQTFREPPTREYNPYR